MDSEHRPPTLDPLAAETFDSSHQIYAELRQTCPVVHSDTWGGFWSLMKYDDVKRAASDWRGFISSKQNVVPKVAFTGRRPPLHLDPPEHTPYRSALNPLLSVARAETLAPATERFAAEQLAPLLAKGGVDICGEFSSLVPVRVFGQWMTLPDDWIDTLRAGVYAFITAVRSADPEKMRQTSYRIYGLARELIAARKEAPMDPATDPTSALLAARVDGEPLHDEMIVGTVRQLLAVGLVAPMVMVGNIGVHLARDRALQSQLRADPSLLPAAIEEFLRLYSPYRGFARTVVDDTEMSGQVIPAGDPVALVYASANRDEAKFPNGAEFQLGRPNIADHLAFGRGPHNCPGANIARMELRVMAQTLLSSTTGFALDGEVEMSAWPEIGPMTVPLKFE